MRVLLAGKSSMRDSDLSLLLERMGLIIDRVDNIQLIDEMLKSVVFDLIIFTTKGEMHDEIKRIILEFRRNGQGVPIFVFIDNGTVDILIDFLNEGADDCLLWPCRIEELEARLHSLLRSKLARKTNVIEYGPLKWNTFSNTFWIDEKLLDITPKEKAVLEVFISNPDVVLTREAIANRVYSFNDYTDHKVIAIYIHRLRQKISNEKIKIETLKHQGYILQKVLNEVVC